MVAVQERTRRRTDETFPASPLQPEPEEEQREPSFVRTVVLGLSLLAGLIAFEIALMFTVAYLVTGRAY